MYKCVYASSEFVEFNFFKDVHVFVVDNYFFEGGGVLLNFIECLFIEIL